MGVTPPARPGVVPELDGLRAIAVLLVLARHAAREYADHAGGDAGWLLPMLNGWMGVDLFFVLSGYLVGTNVLRAVVDRGEGLGRYLLRRVLRIVPAYYAVLLLVASGALPFFPPPSRGLALSVGYHLVFLQDYLPSNIVVAFWSLGVEEKFYLLVPGVVWALARLPPRVAVAVAAGASLLPALGRWWTLSAHPEITTYAGCFPALRSPFHLATDGMAVGLAAALAVRAGFTLGRRARDALFGLGALVVVGLGAQPFLLDAVSFARVVPLFWVLAWAFGAMIYASVQGPTFASRPLGTAFARTTGRLSYALYLVHMVFLGLAWSIAGAAGFVPFALVFGALSTAAALVLHYAVERPFLALRDRL